MKIKSVFKKTNLKKMICRLLVAFVVAGMILPNISVVGERTVYAETTVPDPTLWAIPLESSTQGKTLDGGFYYVDSGTEVSCTNSNAGENGITIAENATVYIYIPEDSKLIAKGGAGSGRTTGGGAGIYVPSTATLIFLGNGTVEATGGKAAAGSQGSQGGSASRNESADTFTTGSGGKGGAGGAGAGAGIGTKGGNGGTGGNGGSGYTVDKDKQTNGADGVAGNPGSSGATMGKVYRAEGVTVTAQGGAAGSAGGSGSAGSNSGAYKWGDPYRGAAGGAGGGGGGGGYAGAAIGTGGPGGAGGGGGAGSGYNWCGYYCGGGGGGGGAGGNGGSGGAKGSTAYLGSWGGNSTRNAELVQTAKIGSAGDFSNGGVGGQYTRLRCTANDGTKTNGYSGTGGKGGTSSYTSATAGSITVISADTESKYYKYSVTFEGADENGEQYYYTGRKTSDGNTVTAPSYTAEEDQYFIGWRVKKNSYAFCFNDSAAEDEAALLLDDETFYPKGAVIKIASDTYGPVVLEPIVVASAGNKAVSEVLTIEPTEYEKPTIYLSYQVETLINGVRKDVGQIALVKDDETYLVSCGSGENKGLYTYTMPSAVSMEEAPVFGVHVKGEDTGVSVSAGDAIQISYKEMQVITRVDGELSDLPGMITLADEDAPIPAKQGTGTYSCVGLETKIDAERKYAIEIDGVDSGQTVSFGETVYIDYFTVQVDIEGNVQIDDVVLRNEEEYVSLPLEYLNGVWSTIQQKHELTYTIYVNGIKSDFNTVRFDDNSTALKLGVYKTRFITRKDNVVTDDLVDDIYLGTQLAQRAGVGTYETIHVINPTEDSDSLNYYVNSMYGVEDAVTALGEDVVLDYYTIRYSGGSENAENVPIDHTIYRKGTNVVLASSGDMSNLGKDFIGWLVKGTTYAVGDEITVNDALQPVAQWQSTSYAITYDMNDSGEDGSEAKAWNPNENLVSYKVDDSITLLDPTRDNAVFMGWTYERTSAETSDEDGNEMDSELNPVKNLTIPAGQIGDITFVAHWAINQYNIDVDITEYDFGTRVEGYADNTLPEALTVTVQNVGNQSVTLSTVTSTPVDETITQSAFLCSDFSKTNLAVGDTATFTIRPKTGVALGEHEEIVTVKTTQGTEVNVSVKFLVGKDTTAPVMTVTIGTDSWSEFEESISDKDMKKYGQSVTVVIDAEDTESPMGRVQYYLAKEQMTQTQLEALSEAEWQTYTASFTITDNKQFILYARAYDTADSANTAWVSTDVLEIDTTAPIIKGVQAGTYYGETTFVVEDANLHTVTLGGSALTPDANGVYTLPVEKGVKKSLVATDIHGYETTIEVTVNNIKYDISYDANGGAGTMATDSIEAGESIVLPAAKFVAPNSKMEFAYWTIQGDQSDTVYIAGSNYVVTDAVTFVANWANKQYNIAFDLQGGKFAEDANIPSKYTGIDESFAIPIPSRLGYDFVGWTWENQTIPVINVTIESGSSTNYQFTANWKESSVAKYVVRHWQMKVNTSDQYELKEEIEYTGEHTTSITPEVATYEGFTSPAMITLTLDAKQEMVVDYYYTRNTYQMDVVVNDTIVESLVGVYGSEQSVIVPNAVGYDLLSLVGVYDFEGNPLSDISEIAPAIQSLVGEDSITALMPAQNIKIVLARTPIAYNITYDLDGGEILIGNNPITYTVATEEFCLTAPEKVGYAFTGWTWEGQQTPVKDVWVNTSANGNLHYKANWAQLNTSVSQGDYLVSYYQQNLDETYSLVESERCYDELEKEVTPLPKNYPGFITPEAITVTVSSENSDDVNYYYDRQCYTLAWEFGEGVRGVNTNLAIFDVDPNTEGIQVYYGTPIEATAILGDGYLSAEFTGFGENAINKKIFTMPAENVSITVVGTPHTYSVIYQLAGGSFAETVKTAYNITEADYTVPVPVRTGYTFDGWSVIVNGVSTNGGSSYIVDTEMCADIILSARWSANEAAYTIRHYKENPDGSGYTEVVADRESGSATVGTVITPAVKNYSGYVSPATISVTVLADNSTEIVYNYDFVECEVEDEKQNVGSLEDIKDKIDEITDIMEEFESNFPEIDDQIADNNSQITKKNEEIEENNNRIKEIEERNEDIDNSIDDINANIDDINSDIASQNERLEEINERLSDENLSDIEKNELESEKAILQEELTDLQSQKASSETEKGNLEAEKAGLEAEKNTLASENIDLQDAIDELQKTNEDLENQKQAGLNENKEYLYFKDKKEKLEKLEENIEKTQEQKGNIYNSLNDSAKNPALDEVTSEDKQNLQDLVNSLDELLEAEPNYLSEEEKNALLDKRTELIEKLQQIKDVEESILEAEDKMQYLPSLEDVNSGDKQSLQDLAETIDKVLQSTNLTQEERNELREERENIQDKLDKIEEIKSKLNDLQDRDDAVDKENVTADDKNTIENLIQDLQQTLDNSENNMTEAEKQDIKNRISQLQDELNNLEQIEEDLKEIENQLTHAPEIDEVTTDDRYAIEDLVDEIDSLLSNNRNHMTEEEKLALNEKKEELLEMLEEIERIQNVIDDAFNKDAEVEVIDNVSSEDLESIEKAQNAINELLQKESDHLTDDQKQALQDTLSDLNAKKELIEEYAEEIKDAKETADKQATIENVKEDDRQKILEAKQKLEDLLENPKNKNHVSDEEKEELAQRVQDLQEKIDRLDAAEDAMEAMDNVFEETSLPDVNEVKTDDLESVEKLYEQVQDMLEDYGGNMSQQKLTEYEELSDTLQEMIENITKVKDVIELVETNYPNIPADEELSSNNIEPIDEMITKIRDILDNYDGNLTDGQKSELESKLAALENKKGILQNTADKLDKIDQMTEQLPKMDSVTSDDKEDLKDLISDIEDTLAMEPCLLSQEDKDALNELLKELQEAVEKLEEVAGEMSDIQDSAAGLSPADEVKTSDKEAIEQLVEDIDQMLSENDDYLSEEEKDELLQLKKELQEKLDSIKDLEEKLDEVENAAAQIPDKNELGTDDEDIVRDTIALIDKFVNDQKERLSEEELKQLADEKSILEEKLGYIEDLIEKLEEVAGEMSDIQDSAAGLSPADEVKTSDKEAIEQLVEDIDQMLSENDDYLSEEEKDELLQLKKELQEKLDSIKDLEEKLDEVENAAAQIPDKNELGTDDEDIVRDTIALIDKFIKDQKERLSEEELKQLADEKSILEEKLGYIEDLIEEEEKEAALKAEIATEMESINNAFNKVNDLDNSGQDSLLSMQQLVGRIAKFIEDQGANLSQNELDHLTSIKSRVQEKINALYSQNQNVGIGDTGNEDTEKEDEDVVLRDDTSEEKDNKEEGNEEGIGNGSYTVEIYSGQKLIERITGLTEGEVLDLAAIEDGIYTIVTTNGEYVDTRMLVVEDGESNVAAVKGVGNKETEVRFTEEEYRMAVEGLEKVFAIPQLDEKIDEVVESGGSCTIRLIIQEPKKTTGMDDMESRAKEAEHKIARVFDFSVEAHIYEQDGKETVIPINDTESLLLIAIPLEEFEKGKAKYYVYRSHEWEAGKGEEVEMLPELIGEEKQNPTKEGFYVDGDHVYIWASKYSLYALAYDDVATTEPDDIIGKDQEPKKCCIWWLLVAVFCALVGVKEYYDYTRDRKEEVN